MRIINNIRVKIFEKNSAVVDVKVEAVEKKFHSIPFVRREFHSVIFFKNFYFVEQTRERMFVEYDNYNLFMSGINHSFNNFIPQLSTWSGSSVLI